jgi:hypothetical protein
VRSVQTISLGRKQMIDKLIIEYIINKMAPINTVDEDFRKLIHFFEPTYQFMSSKSLKTRINDLYEENVAKMIGQFDDVESFSIDFDTWTSIANQSYITINCHAMTNNWKIICFNLETKLIEESHCSAYLKQLVNQILTKFDLEYKINFCIHDNAANMNLVSTLLGISDIRCFAHNWDLVVNELCKTEALKTIITKQD